jgi:hypothetical protein
MWDPFLSRNPAKFVKSARSFAVMLLVSASGAFACGQPPAADAKTAPKSATAPTTAPHDATVTIKVDDATAPASGQGPLDAAIKLAVIPDQIRAASFDVRDALVANVKSQLLTANQFVADLSLRALPLTSEVRDQFQKVVNTARQRATQVGTSIQAVQIAIPEKFAESRNQLANDYAAYVSTIAQLEAIIEANTPQPAVAK